MSGYAVHCGNAAEVLAGYPACHFDACLTDPSYGLNNITPQMVRDCLTAWLAGEEYDAPGNGFMGREWDRFVCGPRYWREVLRVLKPGGWLLAFGGSRTQDLLTIALRLAGFEIRDCLMWLSGAGFPKGHNIAKSLEKEIIRGIEAQGYEFTGWTEE